jgi:hypothetical protein
MDFDPYEAWLGIPAGRRPPTYYDLLGLASDEANPDTIELAALRRMGKIRLHQIGPHSDLSQDVLAELARARLILRRTRTGGPITTPSSEPAAIAAPVPPRSPRRASKPSMHLGNGLDPTKVSPTSSAHSFSPSRKAMPHSRYAPTRKKHPPLGKGASRSGHSW